MFVRSTQVMRRHYIPTLKPTPPKKPRKVETGANLAEWRQGISPALQSAVGAGCTTALQTEYASSLLRISNPKLAPNAFGRHVRNSEHGDAVGDLVGVMLAYGLSYRPVARAG